jgi:hypothetical protein
MKKTQTGLFSLLILAALMVLAQSAGAYSTYSSNGSTGNCANCHGGFRDPAPYVSNFDGVAWSDPTNGNPLNLHDGHRNYMLNGDCNVCHMAASKSPVYTWQSAGGTGFQAISCTGCHNGDGLRAYHVNSGAATCYSCHSAATPPAENVKPPYYFTPDANHPNKPTDSCNANGSESRVAPTAGLDNDGNLLDDANDPACAPAGDATAPTVTAFTIPATSASLVVPISSFTATDNVGVTGYKLTTSVTKPLASGAGWTVNPPKNYTFPTAGTKTLRAWAKDAAGNVSAAMSDQVIITLTDTVKPKVTAFAATASATPLTADITTFTATDNVKVTGYKITETAKAPLAGATGWKLTAPTTYLSKTSGAKTLYAWAKDKAGNVSLSKTAAVTIP